jgi:hypothetical protein
VLPEGYKILAVRLNPFFIVLLFFVSAGLAIGQELPPETDFQVWNETTFTLPVVKAKDEKGKSFDRLTLLLIASLRLGQNRLAPVDERIGGGFDVVLNKHFNFSPTYLYVAAQPARGRKEFEHRLRFEVTYTQKFKHFTIKDRNRIEHRMVNSRTNTTRYRNRVSLHVPVNRDGKELFVPFVSTEPYYNFAVKQWVRNDLAFGISKKLNDHVSADFFGGWRYNRAGLPKDVLIAGVNLKVKLKK